MPPPESRGSGGPPRGAVAGNVKRQRACIQGKVLYSGPECADLDLESTLSSGCTSTGLHDIAMILEHHGAPVV